MPKITGVSLFYDPYGNILRFWSRNKVILEQYNVDSREVIYFYNRMLNLVYDEKSYMYWEIV